MLQCWGFNPFKAIGDGIKSVGKGAASFVKSGIKFVGDVAKKIDLGKLASGALEAGKIALEVAAAFAMGGSLYNLAFGL